MVSSGGFLAYYRVSTGKQGKSGLGIEAQRQAVATYLNGGNWRIVGEFVEVESGRRSDRPELDKALATARVRQVPLVVAKVDRLTRSVAFLSRLLEAGVDVRFADLPAIEGATGKFLLQQMAAVAELEAGMISARTKAALAAAKRRGVKLGGDRGVRLTAKARAAGNAAQRARAQARASDLADTVKELQAAGRESLRAIATSWTLAAFLRHAVANGRPCRSLVCSSASTHRQRSEVAALSGPARPPPSKAVRGG
jgi:DNA invertase Pin-like site-specific DNA recombinase